MCLAKMLGTNGEKEIMPRKKDDRNVSSFGIASQSNEDRIRAAIINNNLHTPSGIRKLFDLVVRHQENIDCVESAYDRAELCKELRFTEPSESDRVHYCRNSGLGSSSNSKRSAEWLRCIDPTHSNLIDQDLYHKLRKTRLMEQIRKCQAQVERDWVKAEHHQEFVEASGDAGATLWDESDNKPIRRYSTGIEALDRICGKSIVGKKTEYGLAVGKVYAFAAEAGAGKSRLCVKLARNMCGPISTSWSGQDVGGLRGVYFQAEMSKADFRSTFLNNVWVPGETDVLLSGDTLLREHERIIFAERPQFIVIDSKDMVNEFVTNSLLVQSVKTYKRWAAEVGAAVIIISHMNGKKEMKGNKNFQHEVDAVILGVRETSDKDVFALSFSKNRMGRVRDKAYFKHTETTVESWSGQIKTEMDTKMALLLSDIDPNYNDNLVEVGERVKGQDNGDEEDDE